MPDEVTYEAATPAIGVQLEMQKLHDQMDRLKTQVHAGNWVSVQDVDNIWDRVKSLDAGVAALVSGSQPQPNPAEVATEAALVQNGDQPV